MEHMKEKLGSWQVSGDEKGGKVRFSLFFPSESGGLQHHISTIQVCGDFQKALGLASWDPVSAPMLTRVAHPEGEIWSYETPTDVPLGFYEYKYYVTYDDPGEPPRWVSDPFARYGGKENMNAALAVGGSRPVDNLIAPLDGGRKPLRDLVIYEMMIDDFTAEYRGVRAPLDAVCDKLEHIAELGFNAILFMPWTAWNDESFNWGYTPSLYYSVSHRYANDLNKPTEKLSWLKKLVSECHKRGIHVIMDGVFNHVYSGFPYKAFYRFYERDCPYTGQFGGKFDELQDLNFNNACTQELIFDVCRYWIDQFGIDGIRFDNTVNYYIKGQAHGLPQLLAAIDGYVGASNFSLTLEHLQMDAVEVVKTTCATSYWDNALYEQCFANLWNGAIQPHLLNTLNNNRYLQGSGKTPTIYLGNHDHSHVAWQAGARNNVGAIEWYRTQPYAIALLTSPGAPLIQNGQEFAEDHWLPEDDQNSARRVQPRPLHWHYVGDKFGGRLKSLYSKLIHLRHNYPVLRADGFYPDIWEEWQHEFNPEGVGTDIARQLAVYRRYCVDGQGTLQHALIALNFSAQSHWIELRFPEDGLWIDLLSEPEWNIVVRDRRYVLEIPSYWGRIFHKQPG